MLAKDSSTHATRMFIVVCKEHMETEHNRVGSHASLIIVDRPHGRRPYDTRLRVIVGYI